MPEVMKIIIAVVCILFLVILSVQLYNLFNSKTRIEQAKTNAENIALRMNALEEGESFTYQLLSPSGYILTGWPIDSKLPSQCLSKGWTNCICFCKYSKDANSNLRSAAHAFFENNILTNWLAEIKLIITLGQSLDPVGGVYDSCQSNHVCTEVKGKTNVNSAKFNDELTIMEVLKKIRKSQNDLIEFIVRMSERKISISVNDLMQYKKAIIVSLKGGVYTIEPE